MSRIKVATISILTLVILGIVLPGCREKLETIPVALSAPADGSTRINVAGAKLSWLKLGESTTKYKVQLAKDLAMTDIIKEPDVVKTEYECPGTLDYGTKYYWRIMAVEPHRSAWSATWSFTTEEAPPPPQAQLPAPAEKPLSFEADTYTNEQYGFYVKYPKSMVLERPTLPLVFAAAEPERVPVIAVAILNIATAEQETIDHIRSLGGSDYKELSNQDTVLSDGKTKGKLYLSSFNIAGTTCSTLALGVDKGDKRIAVSYTTIGAIDEAKAKEILFTLTFIK